MNSDTFQNNESNRNPVVNPFLSAHSSFLQGPNIYNINSNLNPSSNNIIQENQQMVKDESSSKLFEQEKPNINLAPFKSLVNNTQTPKISNSLNVNDISYTTTTNPFANSLMKNDTNISKSFNYNQNNIYKIQLFKSKNKSKEKPQNQSPFNNQIQVINLKNNKNDNYKILIKRIARQLKKKVKKPSKGFFYSYINQEKEKEYKNLVKKIANQLRKRVKFPSNKILKVYESYIILIKRIALQLKESIEKRRKNINIIEEKQNITNTKIPIENMEENIKINKEKSQSSKSKRKQVGLNITMLTKSQIEEENKMRLFDINRKDQKIRGELNNMNDLEYKNEENKELDISEDLNDILSNIDITNNNFAEEFQKFLDKANISIINDFPVSLDEKNKTFYQQNNFWFLFLNYILSKNRNLSIYTLLALLEQYFLWCNEKNIQNFSSIKELIKNYISANFTEEKLRQFLFMNKLNSIDEVFKRYNDIKIKDFQEIKIDELNLRNSKNICECDLCKNEEACVQKVVDINKEKIKITKGQNFDFIGKREKNKNERNMDIDSGDELFFKGISNKKKKIFTESKTKFTENTNFVYTREVNNNIINKIDSDEKNKTYKNISKKRPKASEEKKASDKKEKQEEQEENKEEENKEEENSVKKEESKEEETNVKKRGRPRKDKSRNKYKKKDNSKNIRKEEEDKEPYQQEKQRKRRKSRKSNKSESSQEDETEEKEVENKTRNKKKSRTKNNNKSKKIDDSNDKKEEDVDDNEEDEKSLNKSRRKKSKTPRNKKSQNNNKK